MHVPARPLLLLLALAAAGVAVSGQLEGERVLIKFDAGEARLLLPGGDRVILYQIAAASGVRFTNGYMELRGKGMDLQLIRESVAVRLLDCLPYVPPATPD
jgi:hypothetical protein